MEGKVVFVERGPVGLFNVLGSDETEPVSTKNNPLEPPKGSSTQQDDGGGEPKFN